MTLVPFGEGMHALFLSALFFFFFSSKCLPLFFPVDLPIVGIRAPLIVSWKSPHFSFSFPQRFLIFFLF